MNDFLLRNVPPNNPNTGRQFHYSFKFPIDAESQAAETAAAGIKYLERILSDLKQNPYIGRPPLRPHRHLVANSDHDIAMVRHLTRGLVPSSAQRERSRRMFYRGLKELINKHRLELDSDTSDEHLAQFLWDCLLAYEKCHNESATA